MGYQDIDRRREGTIGGIRTHSGSLAPRQAPYQFSGEATSEARVQFPFTSEWVQITATTSDAVKYSFENSGTGGAKHMVVPGNTTTPILPIQVDELYVKNDYSIIAKLSDVVSGSTNFAIDERA